jgi:hypothetical protein
MDSSYHSKHVLIHAGYTAHKFSDSKSPAGESTYEFEFTLPEWLPPSAIYCADHCTSKFKIKYNFWA